MANTTVRKSTPAWIAVSWLVVLVPALWGFTFTAQSALKIFEPGAAAPAAKTPGAAAKTPAAAGAPAVAAPAK